MKIVALIFIALLLGFLSFQIYGLWSQKRGLEKEFEESQAKFEALEREAANLESEIDYLANPANLEKELRSRFNLKKPGEKTIIIVPKNASSE